MTTICDYGYSGVNTLFIRSHEQSIPCIATDQHGALFMPEEMIKPSILAIELGVTESALAKWRTDGNGPPFCKLGHKVVRYTRSGIEAWKKDRVRKDTKAVP